jgi:hypothetical protein
MSNPIETLQENLTGLYPSIGMTMSPPLDWRNGVWFLDLIHPDVWLIVEWSVATQFGISRYSDNCGIGERPDHAFTTIEEAQRFLDDALKGNVRA